VGHSVLIYVGVRITAEWRGAAPTSGLGVVLDLYKPKPKPKPKRSVRVAIRYGRVEAVGFRHAAHKGTCATCVSSTTVVSTTSELVVEA
jgi:hypothetical protein